MLRNYLDTVGVVGSIPIAPTISSIKSKQIERKLKADSRSAILRISPYFATFCRLDCGKLRESRRAKYAPGNAPLGGES